MRRGRMWTRCYSVDVPGKVVGKGRPRFTRAGHAYTPKATLEFERRVGDAWTAAGHPVLDGPLAVYVSVFRPLPKSAPKRREGERDTYRPDVDNILKAVLDGLNGVAYRDDAQVVQVRAAKARRYRGTAERISVCIERLDS